MQSLPAAPAVTRKAVVYEQRCCAHAACDQATVLLAGLEAGYDKIMWWARVPWFNCHTDEYHKVQPKQFAVNPLTLSAAI